MAKRAAVWTGVAAAVLLLVPGCPAAGFQVYFMNAGDYPVVSLLITPETADDWGDELLETPLSPGESVMLPGRYAAGGVYDVAVVYDTAPETQAGNPVQLTAKVDTSALDAGYLTLWAACKRDGTSGVGYAYGLPD